jgi:hypothetical protein
MIRPLESFANSSFGEFQLREAKTLEAKTFEGGHRHDNAPAIGAVSRQEVHLKSKRKAVAAAYLRTAHAYMLISMPTGTSTIFGVFQAILALLAKPDEIRPP